MGRRRYDGFVLRKKNRQILLIVTIWLTISILRFGFFIDEKDFYTDDGACFVLAAAKLSGELLGPQFLERLLNSSIQFKEIWISNQYDCSIHSQRFLPVFTLVPFVALFKESMLWILPMVIAGLVLILSPYLIDLRKDSSYFAFILSLCMVLSTNIHKLGMTFNVDILIAAYLVLFIILLQRFYLSGSTVTLLSLLAVSAFLYFSRLTLPWILIAIFICSRSVNSNSRIFNKTTLRLSFLIFSLHFVLYKYVNFVPRLPNFEIFSTGGYEINSQPSQYQEPIVKDFAEEGYSRVETFLTPFIYPTKEFVRLLVFDPLISMMIFGVLFTCLRTLKRFFVSRSWARLSEFALMLTSTIGLMFSSVLWANYPGMGFGLILPGIPLTIICATLYSNQVKNWR
jgi:hypothetical protein